MLSAEEKRRIREESLEEGREEGRREGMEEGLREGLREGRREGIEEGRREGIEEGAAMLSEVIRLIAKGASDEEILDKGYNSYVIATAHTCRSDNEKNVQDKH